MKKSFFKPHWFPVTQIYLSICLVISFVCYCGNSSVYGQSWILGNSGASAGWYKLGRLALPQGGSDAVLQLVAGHGYNAHADQNGTCEIHFRTSNGSTNQNGFYASGSYFQTGKSRIVMGLQVVQIDLDTWDFYAELPHFTGDGALLHLRSASGSWQPGFVFTTVPQGVAKIYLEEKLVLGSKLVLNEKVGIGISDPQEALAVNGTIRSREVKVETANWPDYVFESKYPLKPLSEVRAFINEFGHLPEVPSAAIVEKEGISLGEMNKLLLKKIEELTLYLLKKEDEMLEIKKELITLKESIKFKKT